MPIPTTPPPPPLPLGHKMHSMGSRTQRTLCVVNRSMLADADAKNALGFESAGITVDIDGIRRLHFQK